MAFIGLFWYTMSLHVADIIIVSRLNRRLTQRIIWQEIKWALVLGILASTWCESRAIGRGKEFYVRLVQVIFLG